MRQLDGDFVDDCAGPPAHHQHAVRQVTASSRSCVISSAVLPACLSVCARSRCRPCGSAHRPRRTARRAATHADRPRACARAPRAGACRPTAGADNDRKIPRVEIAEQRAGALPLGSGEPWISTPNITFSATVRHGSSRSFCSMKATWAFGPATRSPSTNAAPSLGAVRPGADIEERALAAAARPDQRDDFAVPNRKAHPRTAVSAPRPPVARNASSRCGIRGGRHRHEGRCLGWGDCARVLAQDCCKYSEK